MLTSALVATLCVSAVDGGTSDAGQVALVWGGGTTDEEARVWLDEWKAQSHLLGPEVTLAAKAPRLTRSDAVSGLTPGFSIVLLGVCRADEALSLRRTLKALFPFVYEKPVTGERPACPTATGPTWSFEAASTVKRRTGPSGAARLVVVSATRPGAHGKTQRRFDLLHYAPANDRRPATSERIEDDWPDPEQTSGPVVGCLSELRPLAHGVALDRSCTWPAQAACNHNPGRRTRLSFTLTPDGGLAQTEKVLETWDVDYDKDCAE
jgi:hypothetical protein